jgi:thymidylate synthase (FAD)
MRVFSYAQESTRYVKYNKNDIEFILPHWAKLNTGKYYVENHKVYGDGYIGKYTDNTLLMQLLASEKNYNDLIRRRFKPQDARDILPLSLKTELCMTGFAKDFRHLLDLRLFEKTGKVHPDMLDLMKKLQKVMQENNIWDDVMFWPSNFE